MDNVTINSIYYYIRGINLNRNKISQYCQKHYITLQVTKTYIQKIYNTTRISVFVS